ncbi:MAG: ABC transporter permease subunit [Bacteroidales bacterium]|jgi:ABC-2 type transport system permease protein|nr:ABC transporter permease subunit [Bacteroidales bacterium]
MKVWVIATRELRSFFDSLMAYIMLIAFLGFSGFFTWLYGADIFFVRQASLQVFFSIAYWTLFFFIPALTMKLLAEENRTGTIEMLLTKPISDWEVVLGKFTSVMLLIIIALALTIPYYITVANLGTIDHGAIITGYIGLIFMSAAYVGIGLFASSISNNQIIAFLLALLISIFFHIIFDVLSYSIKGSLGSIFSYLSLSNHYDSISRGVIDSKDIIYFLSIAFFGLVGTEAVIARRNTV